MKTTNYIYNVTKSNGSEVVIEKPYLDLQIVAGLTGGTVTNIRPVEREVVVEYE